MAKNLSLSGIQTGDAIEAKHVSQSINALTGAEAYDITISGSLTVQGPVTGTNGTLNNFSSSYALKSTTASYAENAANIESASYADSALSSSYAHTASYVLNAISSSHALSASFSQTASYVENAQTASYVQTAQNAISSSYALSSSYAATASFIPDDSIFPYSGSAQITGSLVISSSNQDQTLQLYGSGSTIFSIEGSRGTLFSIDDDESDGKLFSVNNVSGTPVLEVHEDNTVKLGKQDGFGIIISGSNPLPNDADAKILITGSIYHSGSNVYFNAPLTASSFKATPGVINQLTASYAISSSVEVTKEVSSSYADTASYVETAQTASYVLNAISSSYALSASFAQTASFVLTSSFAQTASFVLTSSFAHTASYINASNIDQPFTNITASGNISASGNLFISASDVGQASYKTLMLDTTTGRVYHTGSYQGGNASNGFPFIGIAQITGSLRVSGSFYLDYNGNKNIIIGSGSGETLSTGISNIIIGNNSATSLQTGEGNIILGDEAGVGSDFNDENNVIAIGLNAGKDTDFDGNIGDSILIGKNAGRTGNSQNTIAIGTDSGFSNNSTYNVLVGFGTKGDGTNNVGLGYSALGSGAHNYSVAIGSAALGGVSTSNSTGNIAIGYQAFRNPDTNDSNYNIAIGYQAYGISRSTSEGIKNIAIGYQVAPNIFEGNNNIIIGDEAANELVNGNNNIIIGQVAASGSGDTSDKLFIGSGSFAIISGSLNTGDLIFKNSASAQYFNAPQGIINNLTASYAITASFAENVSTPTLQIVTNEGASTTTPITASIISSSANIIAQSFTGSLSGSALEAISSSYALTASYAVSASHEIIKEVSSSYADTASFAQSGNGIFSGSFSGSFAGNGLGLTNIPASGITGLNLSRIASGSVTASIAPNKGFQVNTNTQITGSLILSGSTGNDLEVSNDVFIEGGTTIQGADRTNPYLTIRNSGSSVITSAIQIQSQDPFDSNPKPFHKAGEIRFTDPTQREVQIIAPMTQSQLGETDVHGVMLSLEPRWYSFGTEKQSQVSLSSFGGGGGLINSFFVQVSQSRFYKDVQIDEDLDVQRNITASGNISASGYISASSFSAPPGVINQLTASYAISASVEVTKEVSSSYADTASYVETAQTASYVTLAQTASYVATASYTPTFQQVTDQGATTTNDITIQGANRTGPYLTIFNSGSSGNVSGEMSAIQIHSRDSLAPNPKPIAKAGEIKITDPNDRTLEIIAPMTQSQLGETDIHGAKISLRPRWSMFGIYNESIVEIRSTGVPLLDILNVQVSQSRFYKDVQIDEDLDVQRNITASGNISASGYISASEFVGLVTTAQTASYVETAQTASYVETAQTASYVLNAISSSYALTASHALNTANAKFLVYTTGSGTDSRQSVGSGTASGTAAVVLGGKTNTAASNCAVIAGGNGNTITAASTNGFIGGGKSHCICDSTQGTIAGGDGNRISGGCNNTVSGGYLNHIRNNSFESSIGGGINNQVCENYGTVSGGYSNTIVGGTSVIGGGKSNCITGTCSGILGGINNTADANKSFIVGSDISSTVACHTHVNNLTTTGNITGSNISASGYISASEFIGLVTNAQTASYVEMAQTASYVETAQTASYVENAQTASYITLAQTASYVTTAQTASYVLNAVSSSYALTASYAVSASHEIIKEISSSHADFADTASYVENAQTASFVTTAQTASYVENAQTASFVTTAQTASYVETAQTSSYVILAQTASFVTTAQTASFVTLAQTSSFVTTAQTASYVLASNIDGTITSASYALSASYAVSASHEIIKEISSSYADTASYVENAQTASYVLNAISSSYALSASYSDTASHALNVSIPTLQEVTTAGQTTSGSIIITNTSENNKAWLGTTGANKDGFLALYTGSGVNVYLRPGTSYINSNLHLGGSGNITDQLQVTGDTLITNTLTLGTSLSDFDSTLIVTGSAITTGNIATKGSISASGLIFGRLEETDTSGLKVVVYDPVGGGLFRTGSYNSGGGEGFPFSGSAIITGSLLISGSNVDFTGATGVSGSFSGSFEGEGSGITGIISSSYASTASYIENAQTASYVTTAQTASYVETAQTASYVETAQTASYVETAQTASYVLNAISSSYALTASHALNNDPFPYTGSALITNALTLGTSLSDFDSTLIVTGSAITTGNIATKGSISASGQIFGRLEETDTGDLKVVVYDPAGGGLYRTGSYNSGDGEGFPFSGSAEITGSLLVSGSFVDFTNAPLTASIISASSGITGSLLGTASTASYVENAQTASFVTLAQTASYVTTAQTASYVLNAVSSSYALSASYAVSASHEIIKEISSSHADFADTASYVENAQTASYVATASYTPTFQQVTDQGNTTTQPITSSALKINNGTNISPDSNGNGQLKLNGNAYTGYIAMDGTAMYLGHNSSGRNFVLQTDETDRLTIDGATGNLSASGDVITQKVGIVDGAGIGFGENFVSGNESSDVQIFTDAAGEINFVKDNTTVLAINSGNNISINPSYFLDEPLKITNSITASGNISASGYISASNLDISGSATIDGPLTLTQANTSNPLTINNGTGTEIYFPGTTETNITSQGLFQFKTSNNQGYGFGVNGDDFKAVIGAEGLATSATTVIADTYNGRLILRGNANSNQITGSITMTGSSGVEAFISASSFNATPGTINELTASHAMNVQPENNFMPVATHTTNFTSTSSYAGHYNIVGGTLSITVTTGSTPTDLTPGMEWNFFQTSSGDSFTFTEGTGVEIISRNNQKKLTDLGSAGTLKYISGQTFHLVGDLTI